MNHYRTSKNERVSKTYIDTKVKGAKHQKLEQQINDYGYNFCEGFAKEHESTLDCAHVISVDECQKSGRSELAWDVDNIKILCRSCHREHDKTNIRSAKKNTI